MSNVELLAAKLPMAHSVSTTDMRIAVGTRTTLPRMRTAMSPTTRMRMLETKKLAKMPLTVAPCS